MPAEQRMSVNQRARRRGVRGCASIRLSAAELRVVDAAARKAGVSRTAVIRRGGLELAEKIVGDG